MQLAEKYPIQIVLAVCRRTLFVLAFLGTGVVSSLITGAYSNEREHPFNMTSPESWTGIHILAIYRHFTGFSGLWIGDRVDFEINIARAGLKPHAWDGTLFRSE